MITRDLILRQLGYPAGTYVQYLGDNEEGSMRGRNNFVAGVWECFVGEANILGKGIVCNAEGGLHWAFSRKPTDRAWGYR